MNIKLTWDFDLACYQTLFPEATLLDVDSQSDLETPIDLLIFPGGEDVSLEYYCNSSEIESYKDYCFPNKKRDVHELNILKSALYKNSKMSVNKILGVCRGMQFINVMFDGTLYQDLNQCFGQGHSKVHKIKHKCNNNLHFLEVVNSMHHQAIKGIGSYTTTGERTHPQIIACDNEIGVPEIVTWMDDKILGVQFHPEYFWNNNPDKTEFSDFCYDWIEGKSKIIRGV